MTINLANVMLKEIRSTESMDEVGFLAQLYYGNKKVAEVTYGSGIHYYAYRGCEKIVKQIEVAFSKYFANDIFLEFLLYKFREFDLKLKQMEERRQFFIQNGKTKQIASYCWGLKPLYTKRTLQKEAKKLVEEVRLPEGSIVLNTLSSEELFEFMVDSFKTWNQKIRTAFKK